MILSMLLSNTCILRSSVNERDQVTHPYKTIANCGFVCIDRGVLRQEAGRTPILNWKTGSRKNTDFELKDRKHFPNSVLSQFIFSAKLRIIIFVVYVKTLSMNDVIMSNCGTIHEWWTEKYLEGSGSDAVAVLPWQFVKELMTTAKNVGQSKASPLQRPLVRCRVQFVGTTANVLHRRRFYKVFKTASYKISKLFF
jgi:hypothetical protein